ncbi:Wd Repeat-Containing Protein 91 [Manis pentadactyla]|nr:Wd Repeat-Containing Protein 91 [Manis pentadactyla]
MKLDQDEAITEKTPFIIICINKHLLRASTPSCEPSTLPGTNPSIVLGLEPFLAHHQWLPSSKIKKKRTKSLDLQQLSTFQ